MVVRRHLFLPGPRSVADYSDCRHRLAWLTPTPGENRRPARRGVGWFSISRADLPPVSFPLRTAALTLRVDRVTAEVVRAMRDAGIRTVVLKGPSIAAWLYGDGARPYVDSDLLVAPGSYRRAGAVLRELGFSPLGYSWHRDSETWRRELDGGIVDLHRSLIGISAPPDRVWEELGADTDALRVGGTETAILRLPARAFHVALHAAEHGQDLSHPREDLARALGMASDEVWREAADIARRLDALPAFATGLRFNPAGVRLAKRLELSAERPSAVAVRAAPNVPVAIALENLVGEQALGSRAALLLRALAPPPRYMRRWSASRMAAWPARLREGRLGLALAYLWRPIWILLRLPNALIALRRARRGER